MRPPKATHRAARCRVVCLGAALAAACSTGPDYAPPDLSARTDAAWRKAPDDVVQATREDLGGWWQKLGSPELTALVDRVLVANLSLAEARQRLVVARARRGVVDAARLPQLDGTANVARAGTGDKSLNFQGPPPGQNVDVYGVGVTAGWEFDLWGRVERLTEAADAEIDVAAADYRAAAVATVGELALAYVEASTLHARLAAHRQLVALLTENAQLVAARRDAGLGTELEVAAARRDLAAAKAPGPEFERALAAAENRVAVLVGARPGDGVVAAGDALTLPAAVGLGVPADLLRRRADVQRAERHLAAATARIGAAEAERFPRLSLGGTLALRARDLDALGSGADAISYSFGPNLVVPLFSGGRIDRDVAARTAEAVGDRLALERTLLGAIQEVEDAAAGVAKSRQRLAALDAATAAARDAAGQARALFVAGRGDRLQVLAAERLAVAADDEALQARQAALAWTVRLYLALGGGFEPFPLDAEPPAEAQRP